MSRLYTKSLILALILDLIALSSFMVNHSTLRLFLFLSFHTLATLIISYAIHRIASVRYKGSKRLLFIAIMLFVFAIPIVSYVGLYILNILMRKDKKRDKPQFKHIEVDKLLVIDEIQFVARFFGEGAVTTYITNRELDPNFRLKAFLIISEIVSPTTIQFLKLGLSDTSDEIRLLSFSLINNLEKKISNEIFQLKGMLEDDDCQEVRLKLAKLHWELVYLHLVDETLKDIIIENILNYLDGIETKDAKLILLKIAILKRDFTQVEKILNQLDVDAETVPYFLELAFYQRDFERLKALMKQYPETRFIKKFYSIYRLRHDC
jgi:hypothetical protein